MGTSFVIVSVMKLASVLGIGIGASAIMKTFHEYEFKFKKKGDKNATNDSESLRERVRSIR